MIFKRIKSDGLAHNSYIIGSWNEAAVIDPRRDCKVYAVIAQNEGMQIKYIFETHRNEDYVIGSPELKNITGAEIYHGPRLDWKYGSTLTDGQAFRLGSLRLVAIHTPGHTDESMSYILIDLTTGELPVMVFTGDTIFVGDVGRTDLYGEKEISRLASDLYNSIFKKLLLLGDEVLICPAHGGGSVCGAHIASRDESSIGIERNQNPVLHLVKKDDFIDFKLREKLERPYYFAKMEKYNLEGPPVLGHLPAPPPLSPEEFKAEIQKGAVVIDTSDPHTFGGAHIKGAYNIWGEGLSAFAGWVLPYDHPLLLVLESNRTLNTAVRDLIRIGYDNIAGYLNEGMDGWYNNAFDVERSGLLSVRELKEILGRQEEFTLLDVRSQEEWESGYIQGARHIYVGHLEQGLSEIPKDKPVIVYCSTGHRSSLGVSILLRAGFKTVHNVLGGTSAWTAAEFPVIQN
jgi:hydroxyacylglutathione hydrolase